MGMNWWREAVPFAVKEHAGEGQLVRENEVSAVNRLSLQGSSETYVGMVQTV